MIVFTCRSWVISELCQCHSLSLIIVSYLKMPVLGFSLPTFAQSVSSWYVMFQALPGFKDKDSSCFSPVLSWLTEKELIPVQRDVLADADPLSFCDKQWGAGSPAPQPGTQCFRCLHIPSCPWLTSFTTMLTLHESHVSLLMNTEHAPWSLFSFPGIPWPFLSLRILSIFQSPAGIPTLGSFP